MKPKPNAQGVSSQFLLEGAVYALEEAGLLLHDAYLLYQHQRYGSSIVMALFAREEIGRYQIIRQIRKEMINTHSVVTIEEIVRSCDDHVKKQRSGNIEGVMKLSPGDQLLDLVKARMYNPPQSIAFQEAEHRLNLIMQKRNSEIPHRRHELRQKALYVEPSDSGKTWNRPNTKTKADAFREIEGANNAYGVALDRFMGADVYRDEDPSFYDDLAVWADHATMPNRLVFKEWYSTT